MKTANLLATASLMLLLAACGKEDAPLPGAPSPPPGPPPPSSPAPTPVNRAPSANAGADLSGAPGDTLTLNAAASSDPDADALSYSWVIASGPAGATLANATQASATFQATVAGTYVIEVTVRDPGNLSAVDSLTIAISSAPAPPVFAIGGLPAHVTAGEAGTVSLTLPAAAGPGGTRITLLSSNPGAIEVPASVDVAEGESVVALGIDAAAVGAVTLTATMPGEAPVTLETQVEPELFDLVVSSGDAGVMVGGTPVIGVTLRDPAPAAGARVTLAVSDASRASLSAAELVYAAGTTTANTTLTALAPGAVQIAATLAGTSSTKRRRIGIIPVAASGIRHSESLIEEKRAAGQISEEQALVYRVLATFGAAELPAEFRGNDLGKLDGGAVREATVRLESLAPASQQAIAKYLFPPIYAGSGGAVQKGAPRRLNGLSTNVSCFDRLAGMPYADTLPNWKFIRTASFKIWYPTVVEGRNAQMHLYTPEEVQAAALNVAATIQADFDKLVAVFGGPPLSDGQLVCNGGDAAIDVYVSRVGLGEKAQVMPYLPGECARPGWMWVAPDRIQDAEDARNIIAHELVHLFQLEVARPNCGEWRYNILDEATASWAWDHLHRTDNYEHDYALGDHGYFDGTTGEWNESILYGYGAGASACNGYCDYPFFEWLDRKYGAHAIRNVIEATGSVNAQRAFEVGLGGIGGGLEQLWPKFALAMWNDYDNHVQDEWNGWERLPGASLKKSYVDAGHFLTAELNGAPKRDMSQPLINLVKGSLDPMTMEYVSIRFSDPDVTLIKFEPRGDVLHGKYPRFKLQAIQKVDGQWKAVEDWSGKHEVRYCRDKRAERIEELVLIYSNSHAGDAPFESDPPASIGLFDEDDKLPKLTISNATCMPWHGTSTVTVTNASGGVVRSTGNVTWKPFDPEQEDGDPALVSKLYVPESGTVTTEVRWVEELGCVQTIDFVQGPVGELDGQLQVNTDRRLVVGFGISTIAGPTMHRYRCPGSDETAVPGPAPSNWMKMPLTGAQLGQDGRTIRGSLIESDAMTGTTTTAEWNLSAEREE
jgi:hypothetical protein